MGSIDEQILRATKEIIVKLIEVGRVSPTGIHKTFKEIYTTIEESVKGPPVEPPATPAAQQDRKRDTAAGR